MLDGTQAPTAGDTSTLSVVLGADPVNVARARSLLRGALRDAGGDAWSTTRSWCFRRWSPTRSCTPGRRAAAGLDVAGGLRVEVDDGAAHLPARRDYAAMAGTGRGLQLVEELSDRWGVAPRPDGKSVWFEFGSGDGAGERDRDRALAAAAADDVPLAAATCR